MRNSPYLRILAVIFIITIIVLLNTNLAISGENSKIKNKNKTISQTLQKQTYINYKPASPPQEIIIELPKEASPTLYITPTPTPYEYLSENKFEYLKGLHNFYR